MWLKGPCSTQAALRALYSRKMISCSWKSPSSLRVESHFGQAWKKRTLCPIKTLNLTKKAVQNKNTSVQSRLGEHGPLTVHVLGIRLDWLRWKSFFQLLPPPHVPSSAACTFICSPFCFSGPAPLLGKFILSELNDGFYYSRKAAMDHSLSIAIIGHLHCCFVAQ